MDPPVVKRRAIVRKNVTTCAKRIGDLMSMKEDPAIKWEQEVTELEMQLQRYHEQLLDNDKLIEQEFISNGKLDKLDKEYEDVQKYENIIVLAKANLKCIRNRELSHTHEVTDQSQWLDAIKSLVEVQAQQLRVKEEGRGAASNDATVMERFVALEERRDAGVYNLPPVKLPRFNGDQARFIPFLNEFKKTVHEAKGIDQFRKHKMLRDALDGEAEQAVKEIILSENTYNDTLRRLIDRFGCVVDIVNDIFRKMFHLQRVTKSSDTKALRRLLDQLMNYMITLKMMKVDEQYYACTMYNVLVDAIPDQLSEQFLQTLETKKCDPNQPPSLDIFAEQNLAEESFSRFQKLRDFLEKNIAIKEMQERKNVIDVESESGHKTRAAQPRTKWTPPSTNVYQTASSSNKRGIRPRNSECIFCKGNHNTAFCQVNIPLDEKKNKIKLSGVCMKCLKEGHWGRNCIKKISCSKCKGKHLNVMCDRKVAPTSTLLAVVDAGLLPTGHAIVRGKLGYDKLARILLDSGAQRSFVTSRLANAIHAPIITHEDLYISVFRGTRPEKAQRLPVVKLQIMLNNANVIDLFAYVVDNITNEIIPSPSKMLRNKFRNIRFAEKEDGPTDLGILLNATDSFKIVAGVYKCVDKNTMIIDTGLGHMVMSQPEAGHGNGLAATIAVPNLDRFWDLESLGVTPKELEQKNNLDEAIQNFKSSLVRLSSGHYQVKMNLNDSVSMLNDNKGMASRQLKALAKRLSRDQKLREDYMKEIKGFFAEGFAELSPEDQQPQYFMPHFPVIHPEKVSYKVRPVFNASAAAKGLLSLNDCIKDTPNLLPCPLKALTNFRKYKVAWTGDIRKAYLMVKIHPEHRNFLSFLWFKNEELLTGEVPCRMAVTSFGVKDSQFNTIMVIQEHARLYAHSHPLASDRLIKDLYMDDMLTGADSAEEAVELWRDSTYILRDAGMEMRKFKSNCPQVRHLFGEKGEGADILLRPPEVTKVLGVSWDENADTLQFKPEDMLEFLARAPSTMRTLMGACARLYDPQGLVSPFVMGLKLILQEAHIGKATLDGQLPSDLTKRWLEWGRDLENIAKFRVPRWLTCQPSSGVKLELHAFADASERAYAAVVYLKTVQVGGAVTVTLVASKAKLAPLKQLETFTIPRKELLAALLATRLVRKVKDFLELQEVDIHLWSDAQVVLHWIHSANPERWGVFVRNRLSEILENSSPAQWRHCPGKDNPADLPSRGLSMAKLVENSLWLRGPEFIGRKDSNYAAFRPDPVGTAELPEARIFLAVDGDPLINPAKFSKLSKLVRVFAYVRRAIACFRQKANKAGHKGLASLTGAELTVAKQLLVSQAQRRCLGETWESVSKGIVPEDKQFAAFRPFQDENGLIRVGGRLHSADEPFEVRHPILLAKDPLTTLIIRDAHEGRMMHMKTEAVMSELRENFWIIRMRQLVKSVIRGCTKCLRDTAKLAETEEAPLPASRVELSFSPFKTTGLDYLGPIIVKTGDDEKKVWVALFTCAVVRAVHLEVVEDLSAAACLSAIRRFVAVHGVPARIISDNALNFKKADKCLKALWSGLRSSSVQNFCGESGIVWEFNVPRAPWWGGFFERMVGVVKRCMRRSIGALKLRLVDFITVMHEIAAVVNQRPLTRVPVDPGEPTALTPAMFISHRIPLSLPPGQLKSLGDKPEGLLKLWRQRERILNGFWKRWREEYILMLRTAVRRGGTEGSTLQPGDIVIIKDDSAPRAFWQLGRIEEILPSRDNRSRAYKVHLGKGNFVKRAGRLLAKLL